MLIVCCRLAEDYKEQSWAAMSELEKELQQMEARYGQEFGDASESEEDEEELENEKERANVDRGDVQADGAAEMDDYYDDLYCPACDKSFKSDKAMKNHEKSKKHREMVALLRQQLKEEDKSLSHNSAEREEEEDEDDELDTPRQKLSKRQKKKKRQQKNVNNLPEDPEIDSPVPQSTEEHPAPAPAPDSGNNEDTPFPSEDPDEKLKPEEHEPTNQKSSAKTKGKKDGKDSKKNSKAHGGVEVAQEKEVNLRCVTCLYEFTTRNKLFDHLKTTGHSTALSNNTSQTSKKQKDARKNR